MSKVMIGNTYVATQEDIKRLNQEVVDLKLYIAELQKQIHRKIISLSEKDTQVSDIEKPQRIYDCI